MPAKHSSQEEAEAGGCGVFFQNTNFGQFLVKALSFVTNWTNFVSNFLSALGWINFSTSVWLNIMQPWKTNKKMGEGTEKAP